METFMDQIINLFVMAELGNIYQNDAEYGKRLKNEEMIYEKLYDELTQEQAEQLEQYFIATHFTSERKEALSYIQGMKDLLALLKYLSTDS